MKGIEKQFIVDSDMSHRVLFKGNSIPLWYDNFSISNWYNSSTSPPDYAFFYNTVNDDVYIQYGKNKQGWARATFYGQTVKILKETPKEDGSIDVEVEVATNFFIGRKNNLASGGFRVKYDVSINNITQYKFSGNTFSDFDYGKKPSIKFTTNVKPLETVSNTALKMYIEYPDGQFPSRTMIIGIGLYNPNPPTYIPMAERKNGTWKDLNTNKGKILIRKNGSWLNKSEENINTSKEENKGKNRIRKNGKWLQLPPMKNGGGSEKPPEEKPPEEKPPEEKPPEEKPPTKPSDKPILPMTRTNLYVTSEYGMRNERMHWGIDLGKGGNPLGEKVMAVMSGEVVEAKDGCHSTDSFGCNGGAGNYITIKHDGDKYYTRYLHLGKGVNVKVGDKVKQGQKIGTMANSGSSYGVHLHFEVSPKYPVHSNQINPREYIKDFASVPKT